MLGFRLIVFLAVLSHASALYYPSDEANDIIQKNNLTLVGYTGTNEKSNCSYVSDFEQAINYVKNKLDGHKVIVLLTNDSYPDLQFASPIAVFYQDGYSAIPITWTNDGAEILKWVKRILTLDAAYRLTSQDEYDIFLDRSETLFAAYLLAPEEIKIYKMIAREFNYPFLYTDNSTVAKQLWNISKTSIFANHTWETGRRVEYFDLIGFRHDYNNQTIANWLRKQIQHQVTRLRRADEAAYLFDTSTNSIAVLFTPEDNFEDVKDFTEISKQVIESDKLTAYYVDSENSNFSQLKSFLNVTDDSTIVLVRNHKNFAINPITNRCSPPNYQPEPKITLFNKANMLEDYENALKDLF